VLTAAALGAGAALSGCGDDNEKAAQIKGEPPPAGSPKTQAEYNASIAKGAAGQTSNYPGAKKVK